jgi:Ca2+-binding EF-hand superfamily protein
MRALGQNPTDKELEDMISSADLDGNKTIDFNEFLQTMAKKMKNYEEADELQEAFNCFDTRRCGYINAQDLMQVMSRLGFRICKKFI